MKNFIKKIEKEIQSKKVCMDNLLLIFKYEKCPI